MPSMTKLALSSLALLAYSADAAPIFTSTSGSGSAHANANANAAVSLSGSTDLKVFADAFLKLSTGGRASSCDNVNVGSVLGLAANVKSSLFSKIAVTQCIASYSDAVACTEFGAYLATTYYAYISGWTGATLFAALEATRTDRLHALVGGFCSTATGVSSGACDDWITQWNTFGYASVGLKADVKAAAKATLKTSGLLSVCDTTAILKAAANGQITVGATATAQAAVAAHAAAAVKADVQSKTGVAVPRGLVLGGHGAGQGAGVLGVSLDSITGNKHHDNGLLTNLVAGVGAAGSSKGAVGLGSLIHRDLLDTTHIVGGAHGQGSAHGAGFLGLDGDDLDLGLFGKGQGQGSGILGVTGDKLGLGLSGEGKGKGFLGAVIA